MNEESERAMPERIERALPHAPVGDDTEFVWVNGIAFVNARRHEEVVDRHVARLAELERASEQVGPLVLTHRQAEAVALLIERELATPGDYSPHFPPDEAVEVLDGLSGEAVAAALVEASNVLQDALRGAAAPGITWVRRTT